MKKKEEVYLAYINKKRRTAFTAAALVGTFVLLLGGCGKTQDSSKDDGSEDKAGSGGSEEYLLTVDGYGVTEDEFLLFLRDQKAATTNYYWVNYEMQSDGDFWDTEVDGQTPIEYAKERALDAVVEAKEEFILADERGILEYQDYNGMMDITEEMFRTVAQNVLGTTKVVYGGHELDLGKPFARKTMVEKHT